MEHEKHEWKKQEKELYLPKAEPVSVKIPQMKYFTLTGKGNPNNNKDFQDKISVLYSLSYAVRMMPKNGFIPNGYFEYTVYPLEGVWSLNEEKQKSEALNKDDFIYKIMIRQPDFVDNDVFKRALENAGKKKPSELLNEIRLEEIEDGLCVQMLHIGSYDSEKKSFEKIQKYIEDNGCRRSSLTHREIYISDFTKTEPEKLKTVLRCFVCK